jgi:hypothetical protein
MPAQHSQKRASKDGDAMMMSPRVYPKKEGELSRDKVECSSSIVLYQLTMMMKII